MQEIIKEYEKRESKEAILAKDADNLEWILSLKEQVDIGNERAKSWVVSAIGRLKTENAKILAEQIQKMDSNDWWDVKDGPAYQVNKIKHNKKN
jgi:putative hydrolase of HD superfamily